MTNPLKPELLAITLRGNHIETIHQGWICVLNKDKKIIYKKGNILNNVFLRSLAKPIQAISIIESNLNVLPHELAIISGSHSGSRKHLKLLKKIIKKHKLHLNNLQCGTHIPFDKDEQKNIILNKISLTQLHNNCSGKHLGMLAVCKKNNWDLKTYLNPSHPAQKSILKNIRELSETNKILIATDGCGVPTFAIPVINIAKMFSNFTNSKNKKYHKIISAICKNPFFAGGINQIDTEIIKASKGKLLAKVGAEGIIAVAYKGHSAVIKIADGSQKIRSIVILKLLIKLGWLKEKDILKSEVKNHAGKIVGKIKVLIN